MGIHQILSKYTEGPQVLFDCPKCGSPAGSANTQGTEETFLLYRFLPLFKTRYTDLTCTSCGQSFRLDKRLEKVATLPPEEISRCLRTRLPVLTKVFIICGLVLSPIPFLGLGFSAIGLSAAARKRSSWRVASIVGLVLSLTCSVVLMTLQPWRNEAPSLPGPRLGRPMPSPAARQPLGVVPTRDANRGSFAVGDKVEAELAQQWRPGTVIECRGPMVRVRFDDSAMPPELLLPPNLVRPKK